METVFYIARRRVSLSLVAAQKQQMDQQISDQSVERVVKRSPQMLMNTMIEEAEQQLVSE